MKLNFYCFFTITSLLLTGCASAPISLIEESSFSRLKGKCYQLTQPSVLYKLPKCIDGKSNCFGIQAFGTWEKAPEHLKRIPKSQQQLDSNTQYWNSKLNEGWGKGGNVEFYKSLNEGESFSLLDIVLVDFGTIGKIHVAQLKSNSSEEKVVELASEYHLVQPEWTNDNVNGFSFNNRFIKECAALNSEELL